MYSLLFFIMSIMSFTLALNLFLTKETYVFVFNFFKLISCDLSFLLYIDWMSMMFWWVVCWISASVMLFSDSYMNEDKFKERFVLLVIMFVISMFFMIFSLNLMSILIGWDGLGLSSYILVVYYQNYKSSAAGMLTALSNRIGDVSIIIGITLMVESGSWNFILMNNMMSNSQTLVSLIILASMTKSAMIPFSPWLPAAMAAPTPVSALVHSSTLVTAGIYLLIRFNSFMSISIFKSFIFYMGLLTTLLASFSALFEWDLKKIIALSTLSQLGVMMTIIGLGEKDLAFFHLITHASFKALLFICGGKIIHEMKSTQDIRFMSSLAKNMPIMSMLLLLSNITLAGFPYLAGFYSKDLFVEIFIMNSNNPFLNFLILTSITFTASYSARMVHLSFLYWEMPMNVLEFKSEDKKTSLSTILLIISTLFSGALLSWIMFPSPDPIILPTNMKMKPLIFMTLGGFLGFFKMMDLWDNKHKLTWWFLPSMTMWFIPMFQNKLTLYYLIFSEKTNNLDTSWTEEYSGKGIYKLLNFSTKHLMSTQINSIKFFMFTMMLWVLFF